MVNNAKRVVSNIKCSRVDDKIVVTGGPFVVLPQDTFGVQLSSKIKLGRREILVLSGRVDENTVEWLIPYKTIFTQEDMNVESVVFYFANVVDYQFTIKAGSILADARVLSLGGESKKGDGE